MNPVLALKPAYFIGKGILDFLIGSEFSRPFAFIPNILLAPLLFLTIFYSFIVAQSQFMDLYPIFLLEFTSVSLGYLVQPAVSMLSAVVAELACMMFSGLIFFKK